jgi:hypothetical protein
MRIWTTGSSQSKPGVARRRGSTLKGAKRKGETEFTVESGLSILIRRIIKALSRERMRRTMISLVVWRLTMEDHRGIGLVERGPLMRNLVVKGGKEKILMERGAKKKGLIEQGSTKTSHGMMSLDTAPRTKR